MILTFARFRKSSSPPSKMIIFEAYLNELERQRVEPLSWKDNPPQVYIACKIMKVHEDSIKVEYETYIIKIIISKVIVKK